MSLPSVSSDQVVNIYLTLAHYPILRTRIRARMRKELFERGIVSPQVFEEHVQEEAVQSQIREGMRDPLRQEPPEVWETRLQRLRDHLTDFYFAHNLPYELFEQLIRKTINEQGSPEEEILVSFNPELAPQDMVFEQGLAIEKMPLAQRGWADSRLQSIKVVLIRTLLSDQLAYIKIAKEWFSVVDLYEIRQRRIGGGKIGGKAAGMLLANQILMKAGDEEIRSSLRTPRSYFLGADLTYLFMSTNNLLSSMDQKYRTEAEIRAEYPHIREDYLRGEFPDDILVEFKALLERIGPEPIIVRSSSLLEDSVGASFAGKYESIFCPNQGTPDENLEELSKAIRLVYASTFNPDALLYRRSKGVQDYDERMAILLQVVEGERFGRYYLPHAAGVGFSRNLYRWAPQIHREDGFLRLVWGLGTRAVDQVGDDYPRLVALSHPMLRPEKSSLEINRYSQHYVDLIDLQDNEFKTLRIQEVLQPRYPILRYLVLQDQGGYLVPLRSIASVEDPERLVLTFDEFLHRTPLADRMRRILTLLEEHYHGPVDTEFTVNICEPYAAQPKIEISILQCRPQSHFQGLEVELPENLPEEEIIFSTRRMVPHGLVDDIHYVLFVTPEGYYSLPTQEARASLSNAINKVNTALAGETYICVGPGRWGTTNPDLGVYIGYSDIYNTSALIELTGDLLGSVSPNPSFGTHFFQDLMDAHIYPLAIYLNDRDVIFNRKFFYETPNCIEEFCDAGPCLNNCLRLIRVSSSRPHHHLELVMDDTKGRAVAYLAPDSETETEDKT
jgi:hypothetical protein